MERPNRVKERLGAVCSFDEKTTRTNLDLSAITAEVPLNTSPTVSVGDLNLASIYTAEKNPFFILIVSCCVAHIHSVKSVDYSS